MSLPCPKSELRLRSLLGDLRKMEKHVDPKQDLQSPHPPIALLSTTTNVIPKTVTFDDSPEATKQEDRSRQEEKKDDDDDSVSLMRSPHIMDQSNYGSLEEANAGVLSPSSSEATPNPGRLSLSPFRLKEEQPHDSSLVNGSLIATPSPRETGNDSLLNISFRYPLTRDDIIEGFDETDDEDTPSNSNLTTFQRNAIDLAEQESRRYTERIKEVEDRLEDKTEECNELKLKLDRSEAIVEELRDDLVEQEEIAKQQMQRLLQTFQSKLHEMAQSFENRADALDEKQSWAKVALDRILEDVDFTRHSSYYGHNSQHEEEEEVVSAMSSDASATLSNDGRNDTVGFESHLGFIMGSPHAVMTDPAAAPSNKSNDDWMAEKEELVMEIGNLKSELELTKAGSESLKKMLEDNQENHNLRKENEKLLKDISQLKNDIRSKTTQFADVQRQLVDAQVIASATCQPKQAKKRSFWPRSKARNYKVKSPIKTPLASPSKHLKDTISALRSQIAVLEAKRVDLTAALDRVQSDSKVHQMTASKLARDLGKAKEELQVLKSKSNDSHALNEKIIHLEQELQIANESCKSALKEKGQFRREHDIKIEDLKHQLSTEKGIVEQIEDSWKQSEQKCGELSNKLQHFQELDRDSKVLMAGLKKKMVQLQQRCDELERQKSAIEQQKAAYEREGHRPNSEDESTIKELKERLSHATEIESQLASTRYQRDDLLNQLEEIANRLLEVHPEMNNENQALGGIPVQTLVQHSHRRIEELLAAEDKLDVMQGKLKESKERASQLWSKCIRWETIHDRDTKQLERAQSELRRIRTIAEQRSVLQTIQKQKTEFQQRRAVALEVNCRSQQKELENIASVLFDGQPSLSVNGSTE